MAPSSRRSVATPARSRQSVPARQTAELPEYQPPAAPLNDKALHALETIFLKHDLKHLKTRLQKTNSSLSESISDATEIITFRMAQIEDRKERAKRDPDATGPVTGEEEALAMQERVHDLIAKVEERVRATIDAQTRLEAREGAFKQVSAAAKAGEGTIEMPATQTTLGASQFQSRGTTAGEDDEEGVGSAGQGVFRAVVQNVQERGNRYNNLSMEDKYMSHNDYIHFKQYVHIGQYPNEETKPPLPDAKTWFRDGQPNLNIRSEDAGDDDGSQQDVEAVLERVNVKCPITLSAMRDPVTSKKCPHSFERNAILEMISLSNLRLGDNRGEQAIQCPKCDKVLSKDDLKDDPVLKRQCLRVMEKERRDQETQDRDEDEFDEDDTRDAAALKEKLKRKPEEIGSDDDEDSRPPATKVKPEMLESRSTIQGTAVSDEEDITGLATEENSMERDDGDENEDEELYE